MNLVGTVMASCVFLIIVAFMPLESTAQTLEELDRSLEGVSSLDEFLSDGDAQKRYFEALSKYFQISREKYDQILFALDDFYSELPDEAEKLWRTGEAIEHLFEERGATSSLVLRNHRSLENFHTNWLESLTEAIENSPALNSITDARLSSVLRREKIRAYSASLEAERKKLKEKRDAGLAKASNKRQKRAVEAEFYLELKKLEADLADAILFDALTDDQSPLRDALMGGNLEHAISSLQDLQSNGLGTMARESIRERVRARLIFLKDSEGPYTRLRRVEFQAGRKEGGTQSAGENEVQFVARQPMRSLHAIFAGVHFKECVACDPRRFLYPVVEGAEVWFVEANGRFQGVMSTRPSLLVDSPNEVYLNFELQGPFSRPVSRLDRDGDRPLYMSLFDFLQSRASAEGYRGLSLGLDPTINNFSIVQNLVEQPEIGSQPLGRFVRRRPEQIDQIASVTPQSESYSTARLVDDMGLSERANMESVLFVLGPKSFEQVLEELLGREPPSPSELEALVGQVLSTEYLGLVNEHLELWKENEEEAVHPRHAPLQMIELRIKTFREKLKSKFPLWYDSNKTNIHSSLRSRIRQHTGLSFFIEARLFPESSIESLALRGGVFLELSDQVSSTEQVASGFVGSDESLESLITRLVPSGGFVALTDRFYVTEVLHLFHKYSDQLESSLLRWVDESDKDYGEEEVNSMLDQIEADRRKLTGLQTSEGKTDQFKEFKAMHDVLIMQLAARLRAELIFMEIDRSYWGGIDVEKEKLRLAEVFRSKNEQEIKSRYGLNREDYAVLRAYAEALGVFHQEPERSAIQLRAAELLADLCSN